MTKFRPFTYLDWARLETITGLDRRELGQLAEEAHNHFVKGTITDRKGKVRPVDKPSRLMKQVHRDLLRGFFDGLRPHPCSACVKGKGPVWAAKVHAGALFFLHLDVADHFPSVTQDRVFSRFVEAGARMDIAWVLARVLCLPNRLPQGAPGSNAVAEVIMYGLDARLSGRARAAGLKYTRYVDDLAFSGGPVLLELADSLRETVDDEGWTLNDKGGLAGPAEHHELLGLTVNHGPSVGRDYVRALRSDLRKAANGHIPVTPEDLRSIRGRVAWATQHNPGRGALLRRLLEHAEAMVA